MPAKGKRAPAGAPDHQQLLRQIILLVVGFAIAVALIAYDLLANEDAPGSLFYLGLVILAILGFLGARWVFTSTEAFTSMAVAELPPFWLLIYVLVTTAMIVLLPVALIILLVRYAVARRRFLRQAAGARRTGSVFLD